VFEKGQFMNNKRPLGLLLTTEGVPFSPPKSPKVRNIMFNIEVESPLKIHICENVIVLNFREEQLPSYMLKQNAQVELQSTNHANADEGACKL